MIKVFNMDVMKGLKQIPSESVDCCITSPPYWGLRDYGTGKWEGGSIDCDHVEPRGGSNPETSGKQLTSAGTQLIQYNNICAKCGAKRIDNQIGLEKTPEEYVAKLVDVFRDVKRVLKKEGTLWLNLGDSYASNGVIVQTDEATGWKHGKLENEKRSRARGAGSNGLKPKDLVGIPWRVAFALQADGWWLRQDIIWHKPNPMPESVTDRCTKSHEYVFLLAKSAKYYYDNEAIKEPVAEVSLKRSEYSWDCDRPSTKNKDGIHTEKMGTRFVDPNGRNKRSVWTITTKPFKEAHFATFPEDLIEPMVKAGCPEFVCNKCGKAREKIYEQGEFIHTGGSRIKDTPSISEEQKQGTGYHQHIEIGLSDCGCNDGFSGGIVLDPFVGSGTTLKVARDLKRNSIGIELNPAYVEIIKRRLFNGCQPLTDDFEVIFEKPTTEDLR